MKLTSLLSTTVVVLALLTPSAKAQTACSTLGATWTAPDLAITLTGATPDSRTVTMLSPSNTPTNMGHLNLGLGFPMFAAFMGTTDASGALSDSITLTRIPPSGLTVYLQSVTMSMSGTGGGGGHRGGHGSGGGMNMTFCLSNVASVQF